jgi:hypothetical protein
MQKLELTAEQRKALRSIGEQVGRKLAGKAVKGINGKTYQGFLHPVKIEAMAKATAEAFAVRGVLTFEKAQAILNAIFVAPGAPQKANQENYGLTPRQGNVNARAGAIVRARSKAVKALLAKEAAKVAAVEVTETPAAPVQA